tara:strand:- start:319 stop:978 length:660 start_codon:yes stop_codon:yes gene_type:complete
MKRFVCLFFVAAVLAASCGSDSDTGIAEPTPTSEDLLAKPDTKSDEQILIEDLWDKQAARAEVDIERVFRLFQQKQAVGPYNMACWGPIVEDKVSDDSNGDTSSSSVVVPEVEGPNVCEELAHAMGLLGGPLKDVLPLLDSLQLPWRLVVRDCEGQPVTLDIEAGRVNLETYEDHVVAYTVESLSNGWDRRSLEPGPCEQEKKPKADDRIPVPESSDDE